MTEKDLYSQEKESETIFKRTSLRTGVGLGMNMGLQEEGLGLVYSIGWQKSYGKKNKFRLNPNMIIGGFIGAGLHSRQQFYRITSLGLNLHYDLLKYKTFSIVPTVGLFMNYSRGILGTRSRGDSEDSITESESLTNFYVGGNFSLGVRYSPKDKKLAYEVRLVTVQAGNDEFVLGYIMFGIDFKFKE